ncbi:hypothetical protein LTR28_006826 [Elasticomyces elasticus]|nr:hypothetical protein LTR28_006826 [Elasticomyces elasticus]
MPLRFSEIESPRRLHTVPFEGYPQSPFPLNQNFVRVDDDISPSDSESSFLSSGMPCSAEAFTASPQAAAALGDGPHPPETPTQQVCEPALSDPEGVMMTLDDDLHGIPLGAHMDSDCVGFDSQVEEGIHTAEGAIFTIGRGSAGQPAQSCIQPLVGSAFRRGSQNPRLQRTVSSPPLHTMLSPVSEHSDPTSPMAMSSSAGSSSPATPLAPESPLVEFSRINGEQTTEHGREYSIVWPDTWVPASSLRDGGAFAVEEWSKRRLASHH